MMMTGHEDANARRSAALKGRPRPLEVRQKISSSKRGHPVSEEQRAKISAALKGRKCSPERCMNTRVAERVIKLFKPEAYEAKQARARATLIKCWQDPDFVARRAAGQKARWERYHAAKETKDERWQRILAMRSSGMTKAAIARHLGVSHQRVCQILKKIERRTA
jgi:DNA-directed RNA polymerase specialized sigma subunit